MVWCYTQDSTQNYLFASKEKCEVGKKVAEAFVPVHLDKCQKMLGRVYSTPVASNETSPLIMCELDVCRNVKGKLHICTL